MWFEIGLKLFLGILSEISPGFRNPKFLNSKILIFLLESSYDDLGENRQLSDVHDISNAAVTKSGVLKGMFIAFINKTYAWRESVLNNCKVFSAVSGYSLHLSEWTIRNKL